MTRVIIGADIGGTSTRVGVAELTGRFLAVVRGGPANPNGVGHQPAIAEIRRVTTEALRKAGAVAGEPLEVAGVVHGLAGVTAIADPPAFGLAALPPMTPERPPVSMVTDLEVAYASGTPAADGHVLIAGTGSMAGTIQSGALITRRDGWGWLLGDDGSGYWLGREAVRSTLTQLEAGEAPGPLARAVLAQAVPDGEAGADQLIQHSYARPPRELSKYAPLVARLADQDPAAAGIADRAAEVLATTLASLDPAPGRPIVLAGSVLLIGTDEATPVGARLRGLLAARLDNPLFEAGPGVAGAAWLALPAAAERDPELHTRLVDSALALTG